MTTVSLTWLDDAITAIFEAAGFSTEAARTVSGVLTEADASGVPSHGAMLVPMYIKRIAAGSVSREEQAEVVHSFGAVHVLDAKNALGAISGRQAMDLAVASAKEHGLGAAAVRHAFHFGQALPYARQAGAAGMIGIAMSNTRPLMPAPGGAQTVVGNNPLAVCVPVGAPGAGEDQQYFGLDMALSAAALGKIRLAEAEGREIPDTWATDKDGTPTTDPTAAIAGMLLPMAGPKGFGLALTVDILAGILSGGAYGDKVAGLYKNMAEPNDCAHFFLAIDPAAFGEREEFLARTADLARQVTESDRAPGVERVVLPGQFEQDKRDAAKDGGVTLEDSVLQGLRDAAESVGATLPEIA